jgi:hypothetical protein
MIIFSLQAVTIGQNVLSGTNINLLVCWLCHAYLEHDLKAKLPPRL